MFVFYVYPTYTFVTSVYPLEARINKRQNNKKKVTYIPSSLLCTNIILRGVAQEICSAIFFVFDLATLSNKINNTGGLT